MVFTTHIFLFYLVPLFIAVALTIGLGAALSAAEPREHLNVRISFGHRSAQRSEIAPRLVAGSPALEVTVETKTLIVGAGAVGSWTGQLTWTKPAEPLRKPHEIWSYLLQHGQPGQIARLKDDSALIPASPVLTVLTAADGTRGFSMSIEQLIRHGALWLPEHDAFVTRADTPVDFAAHLGSLRGERVLDRVRREPEATLADFRARFEVPEQAVNDLFGANLWHALMRPRFREDGRTDLPYSNFAYGQLNADWPINQAVYVDYMLYGLRGHSAVAEEEFAAMFRSQQKPDGRIGGYAEWGVYSPGMLCSIGQNYLLSRDGASFDRLLPAALKTLDWCLEEVARAQISQDAPGLIVAPLNDLTHEARAWAFPNACFVAGLDVFGRALAAHGHPRANRVRAVAGKMRTDVGRAFARGSVNSPVVQLADGTWNNQVPCDALTPRRLLDQWYPTDVDCGPLHLARLSAIDPDGWLATAMLHDHEDNLFLNQAGAANEPVYNEQATAYLRRDEPEAAIRAFYSMMACAFSHHQLSPLEHRWAWGQYYGPPSTDGAWFELYRNLLLNELGEGLTIGQAVPRAWLADGQRIAVVGAPTWFGPVNLQFESAVANKHITTKIEFASDRRPPALLVRFRHPEKGRMRAVTVNGREWKDFDAAKEWVRIPSPREKQYHIVAGY